MSKPKLLTQVRNVIRMRHMSRQTEKSYVYYIRQFILFHNKRHPEDMGTKVHLLPEEIDQEIAPLKRDALGISIDTLTSEMIEYKNRWETGT